MVASLAVPTTVGDGAVKVDYDGSRIAEVEIEQVFELSIELNPSANTRRGRPDRTYPDVYQRRMTLWECLRIQSGFRLVALQ